MAFVVRLENAGGQDVLTLVDAEIGRPGPGQVRLTQTAIGINYIDIYRHIDFHPSPLPTGRTSGSPLLPLEQPHRPAASTGSSEVAAASPRPGGQ